MTFGTRAPVEGRGGRRAHDAPRRRAPPHAARRSRSTWTSTSRGSRAIVPCGIATYPVTSLRAARRRPCTSTRSPIGSARRSPRGSARARPSTAPPSTAATVARVPTPVGVRRLARAGVDTDGAARAPRRASPPWLRVPATMGEDFLSLTRAHEGPRARDGLRGGGLPEHLRVLVGRHRDVHGERRPLHAGVRLLPRRHPAAAGARPDRARAGRRGGRIASGSPTRSSRASRATTCATGAPARSRRASTAIRARGPVMRRRGADVGPEGRRARRSQLLLDARPDVLNHNVETVARLQRAVRPSAGYARSLTVLARAAAAGLATKSGLMVGLGETLDEVVSTLADLAARRRAHRDDRPVPPPERDAPAGRALLGARGVRRARRRRAAASASPTSRPRRSRARATTRATPTPRRSPSRCARGAERATDATHAASRHDGVRGARRLGGAGRLRRRRARGGGRRAMRRRSGCSATSRRTPTPSPPCRSSRPGYMTVSAHVGIPEHVLVSVGVRHGAEGLRPGHRDDHLRPARTAGSSGSPTCSPVPRPAVLRGLRREPPTPIELLDHEGRRPSLASPTAPAVRSGATCASPSPTCPTARVGAGGPRSATSARWCCAATRCS